MHERHKKSEMITPEHLFSTSAEGPLMVFGGPYSNLEATQALLEEAARLGIDAEHMICTDDIVAYGADAAATVDLIRSRGCRVVMGNCEESLASGADNCGSGVPAGGTCERLSAAWFAHALAQLGSDARTWMASLPRRIALEFVGLRLAVIHGGIEKINRFIFASTATIIKERERSCADVDGIVAGHCGFSQGIGPGIWHNAGVIGMPANDGMPRVWYSLLTPAKDGLSIEHRALEYDFARAAAKMRRARLPEEYYPSPTSSL